MKKMLIIVACLALVSLAGCLTRPSTNRNKTQLYQAVQSYIHQHGEGTVSLGQLTDFDWDQVLYFYYSNPSDIYDAIGVHFTETDLTTGLLFIKNGELVHSEILPQKSKGIDVYPVNLTMQNVGQKLRVFQRDDVFEVGVTTDAFGNELYWLKVVD